MSIESKVHEGVTRAFDELNVPGIDNELMALLQSKMSTNEQQLFIMSFALYMQHGPDDFVIDLDDAWEWAGFARKGFAKKSLIKHMVEGRDYKLLLARMFKQNDEDDDVAVPRGGQNKESIMMTVDAFKDLCMTARTEKGTRVRQYFRVMERVLHEYMHTKKLTYETRLAQEAELRLSLQNELSTQQETHKIAEKKLTHDALMTANKDTPLVYLAELTEFGQLPDGRFLVKFGESDDIAARLPYLRKEYGKIYFAKTYVCARPHRYEQWLKQQPIFVKCKYTGYVNGHKHQELLAVTPTDYEKVKRIMENNLNIFSGWTPEQTLEKIRLQNEPIRLKHEALKLQTFADMLKSVIAMTDQESRISVEKAITDAINKLSLNTPIPSVTECAKPEQFDETGSDDDSETDENIPMSVEAVESIPTPIEEVQTTTYANVITPTMDTPNNDDVHLFPPQPKRKMGRPPKAKTPPATDANTPLQRFIDECFDTSDPDAKTHVALVRARHRLWRASHVNREETKQMVDFFKDRFHIVLEMDGDHDMRSSFYVGLAMKPWIPPTAPENQVRVDIDAFVREECEVHVMGRARTHDLWEAFAAWKLEKEPAFVPTDKERLRFVSYMKHSFVGHTGVPITKSAVGAPGYYGVYLKNASAETREVGWNRSPNTHCSVYKLDARGKIVGIIESQDAFAHNIAKKSAQHMCGEFTKCFKDGMRGVILDDGYCYMRSKDHATMMNSRS